MRKNWQLYLIVLPVLVFYFIFSYKPMYGALIAFQDYSPGKGFTASPWVGFKHFIRFFNEPDFIRILSNTVKINVVNLIFGFPAPIILALLLNEVKNAVFKRAAQTLTYLPHFISIVVVCGIIRDFVGSGGVVTSVYRFFTQAEAKNLLGVADFFVPIYVLSDIWQGLGWGSIIYLAALSAIDTQLYEAAKIDGAGKWRRLFVVTLPGIAPTIVIMLILRIGSLLSLGFEKIILLYNALIYRTSDVISTYVYRLGFESQQWSYTTAIGLFNSVINFALLVGANKISKSFSDTSLW
jgi:putative aldouronate transport system permease protein